MKGNLRRWEAGGGVKLALKSQRSGKFVGNACLAGFIIFSGLGVAEGLEMRH
jgi:hypothetical protein